MYPHSVHLGSLSISIWNLAFLIGLAVGFPVLRSTVRRQGVRLPWLAMRYVLTVYLAALAAQLFAYAFDANTSLLPPPGRSLAAHVLDPLAGPKTLYGAIVLLPPILWVAMAGSAWPLPRSLDLWTPALFTVLAVARVGCFLQGCCHGARAAWFAMRFPPGGPAYHEQLRAGAIAAGDWTLPVVPVQAMEATVLGLVAFASWRYAGRRGAFRAGLVVYSVFRFLSEFVRADVERGLYGPLATSQWIALAVLATVLATRRVAVAEPMGRAPGVSVATAGSQWRFLSR